MQLNLLQIVIHNICQRYSAQGCSIKIYMGWRTATLFLICRRLVLEEKNIFCRLCHQFLLICRRLCGRKIFIFSWAVIYSKAMSISEEQSPKPKTKIRFPEKTAILDSHDHVTKNAVLLLAKLQHPLKLCTAPATV